MPRARRRQSGRQSTGRQSLRNRPVVASPTPDPVDEDMPDAPSSPSAAAEASPEAEAADDDDDADPDVEEPLPEPEDNDDEPEFVVIKNPSEDPPSPPPEPPPRKRRIGRPPKYPRPDRENGRDSEAGTPVKRRRGRPPGPGYRGRGRGAAPVGPLRVKINKEGDTAEVQDDEVQLPSDPEGEEKVDKDGNLQGGREYRVRTFTLLNRGTRLYMLSTEPARCCGFRDSYLFFTKHMHLHKVVIEEDEKRDLIDRDIIPHSYKGRAIGCVTARSVFREFGARIIVGGKRIIDDYHVMDARARGDQEGELADPHDALPPEGQPYNRNQYVAWHGASAVYHTNVPAIPILNGKPAPLKRRVQITSANWQVEHARAASLFNTTLVEQRKHAWDGIYDPHTNLMHYPKITQPTHAKWEHISSPSPESDLPAQKLITNGAGSAPSKFPPVSDLVARNFVVADVVFATPPLSGLGVPGPDGAAHDVGPNGLPDVDDDLLEELPVECREALLDAKKREEEWQREWRSEATDGLRADVRVNYLGFPV